MIRKSRARNSSLFLMELILAILFFSITSAVCVQFFVKSHILNQDSRILTNAVNQCSAAAEVCSTSDDADTAGKLLLEIYPGAEICNADKTAVIYFDSDFNQCAKKDSVYRMMVLLHENEDMLSANIRFEDITGDTEESTIYELDTRHHIARRTADE